MNRWNKIAAAVVAMASLLTAYAKEIEPISVVENESVTITAPFAVKSFAPSNKDVARVEALGGTLLRVTALRRGRCDLDVSGDNGLTQKYEITVVGDLASVLETLTMDLDQVPEVKAEIRGNFIRLDGEVSSIQKWEYLMKVCANYGNTIKNFAKFYPGPELLIRLKETFEQAGFTAQFEPFKGAQKTWPADVIALDLNKRTRILNVQARLLNESHMVPILAILKGEPWLAVNLEDWKKPVEVSPEKAPYVVKAMLNMFIDKPIIRLSVAYMAIGEEDIKQIGNPNAANGVLGLSGAFDVLRDFISGSTRSQNSQIGASLDVTARFFKGNGISRISDTGYTIMESWDPQGAKFKSGGTMFVKTGGAVVSGGQGAVSNSGSSDLKEIPYGFTINAKGGLTDADTMSCDFDFMVSSIGASTVSPGDYDRMETTTKQKISLPIGKTTLIGGFKKLVDENTPPSGLPILRSTPILNWFVADSGKSVSDRRLVIMVCPELVDNTQDTKPDVDKEINIRVQDQGGKDTDQVIEERKEQKHSGFWYWLNWFDF